MRFKEKPQYIIVLGTGYSGSGAVYDYLAGRGDLRDPLAGAEYLLPHAPHGLMAIEAAAGQAFHTATSDYSVNKFIELAYRLARRERIWRYGRDYTSYLENFLPAIDKFVQQVVKSKMPIRMHWRSMKKNNSKYFLEKLSARFGVRSAGEPAFLLGSSELVIRCSECMHDDIFHSGEGGRVVLLNQAGSGFNPVQSTKYFKKRKVVLVLRDPRDQYAELKLYKGSSDVDKFVEWYLQMQERVKDVDNTLVFKVRFEDFVGNHAESAKAMCEQFCINATLPSIYNPEDSQKNVGIYRGVLDSRERVAIEKSLTTYLC